MSSNFTIRQPIITVAGHVDHGKTSILDAIRCSSVAECEAGAITQKISFTSFTYDNVKSSCPLITSSGVKLEIPGFLFIDTPGHAAFNHLRRRGGSLADLAIVVIDINEGIKPQTSEVIQILRSFKTPFIVALNKLDKISGWQRISGNLVENIEKQPIHVKNYFDERVYTIIGSLNSFGFESDLFYRIKDFTKKVALVPCSAKTKEGIPEILFVLCGLSQKFLRDKLALGKLARGTILEIKKEKSQSYIEAILYDGVLQENDEIAIASFEEPIFTRVKVLQEILPLSSKFKPVKEVSAAAGIRMQFSDKVEILPGMPFCTFERRDQIIEELKQDVPKIEIDKKGIIIKADSLGSLEALIFLLREKNINIVRAGIGPINKNDLITARANFEIDELDAVVIGFNVETEREIEELAKSWGIKIICGDVIYNIIDNLSIFRIEKSKEIERRRLMGLSKLSKIEILHNFVFRNSNPAIFGVRIVGGILTAGTELIDDAGEVVGKVKSIQSEGNSVDEATEGMEVAISVPGISFDRHLRGKKFLYSNLTEKNISEFKKNKDLLSSNEIMILQEIIQIKKMDV
ncbi:MAG: translation initiation factor IF-2 [Candidatus Pacearchaeota archaeon]